MKTKLYLTVLIASAIQMVKAQTYEKPYVENVGDRICYINKIEIGKDFTVVSFEHLNNNNGTITIDPKITINAKDGKSYKFIKATDIPVKPYNFQFTDEMAKREFKVYFEKIPKTLKSFDIIEADPGSKYDFNFYGVDVTKTRKPGPQTAHFPDEEVIAIDTAFTDGPNSHMGMPKDGFNFGNMFKDVYSSVFESYYNYFKKPDSLKDIAILTKKYYDELISAGFTKEQAMQILVANPLLQGIGKK